jgi:hypothetical protein
VFVAGAAGVGIAAAVVGVAKPADADNGNPVELGESNSETETTSIVNAAGGAFSGTTSANGGHSGVHGNDTSTGGGYGVAGNSDNGQGVNGTTSGNGQAGVYGNDASPDGAYGVYGFTRVGTGVYGMATSGGYGVSGDSTIDHGVHGTSESGTGVYATSPEGYALQAVGTSQFNGSVQFSESGVATVAAENSSVTVSEAALSTSSLVLATLHGAALAGVWVQTVIPDVAKKSFPDHPFGQGANWKNSQGRLVPRELRSIGRDWTPWLPVTGIGAESAFGRDPCLGSRVLDALYRYGGKISPTVGGGEAWP